MARPWVLAFVLMLIMFTSQFEWKQQFGNEIEATSVISNKDQHSDTKRHELVKEKIILSQEKNIQKLRELVRSLQEQLTQCQSENSAANSTVMPSSETEILHELEKRAILD